MASNVEALLGVNFTDFIKMHEKKKSQHAIVPKVNRKHHPVKEFDLEPDCRPMVEALWGLEYSTFGRREFIDNLAVQNDNFSRGRSIYPYSEWKDAQDNMVGRWISHELLTQSASSFFLDITPQLLQRLKNRQHLAFQRKPS